MNTSVEPEQSAGAGTARSGARPGASIRFENWGYRHASRSRFSLQGLNLTISAGERVLLLGASGIGKSTMLEAVAGLLGAGAVNGEEDSEGGISQGAVLVDGVPAVQARGAVGLVLQDPEAQAVFERIGDNVAFGPENMGVPRDEIWERVRRSMADTGLEGLQLHRSSAHLSGGQMQRLALAGVLAMHPRALLLDEPTANLDPAGVEQTVQSVARVLETTGATMVLVEHRVDPWIDTVNRVVVLGKEHDQEQGSRAVVLADGTPQEVFTRKDVDFASLGIWVPQRWRRPEDEVKRIHVEGEPGTDPAQGSGDVVLSTHDLAVGRNGNAIASHINLEFSTGQITAIVGHNGAGKSTLALTLAGLLEPVDGTVEASPSLQAGTASAQPYQWSSAQLAARISYVFQNPEHQFATGSVLEEVKLGPVRTGVEPDHATALAEGLLERFGLSAHANANPYTLSGGEKRRLTVASALAAAPKVVILDEPTFGQDRVTWMRIAELIQSLRADGVSIIVITHDRDLVTALGARVVELASAPASHAPAQAVHETAIPSDEQVTVSSVNDRSEEEKPSSRSRFLASLNPAWRMIGGFLVSLPMLLSLDWVSALVALGLEFVALLAMGFKPWTVVRHTWPVFIGAPGSALAVLLYGKEGGALWWHWGMINITERSATLALATGLRVLAIGVPAVIAMLGIDATDLADSLSQVLHLPDRFVYGGLAGMRMFSVLRDDWAALTASRRSRGLGDDNKIKAFFPQAFALIVLSIRRSTTLSVAMEARGFGGETIRTHARVSQVHRRDHMFALGCFAVPVVALLAAWAAGTFVFFGG